MYCIYFTYTCDLREEDVWRPFVRTNITPHTSFVCYTILYARTYDLERVMYVHACVYLDKITLEFRIRLFNTIYWNHTCANSLDSVHSWKIQNYICNSPCVVCMCVYCVVYVCVYFACMFIFPGSDSL